MITKDQILAMEPGRDLDILVAQRYFGFKTEQDRIITGFTFHEPKIPEYSTNVLDCSPILNGEGPKFIMKVIYSGEYDKFKIPEAIAKAAVVETLEDEASEEPVTTDYQQADSGNMILKGEG